MNSEHYFSFGSNMDRTQMKKRTPLAEYVGVGYVPNHDLVFNRKGSYRPGGVASIARFEGRNAYGVIWAISSEELEEMDRIEDPNAYERVEMNVVVANGDLLPCYVYVAFPEGELIADQPYLEIIISAAKSAKLPKDWIERIEQYRV